MEAGQVEEAEALVEQGQRIAPVTVEWYSGYFRFRDSANLDRLLSALRQAGLPNQ